MLYLFTPCGFIMNRNGWSALSETVVATEWNLLLLTVEFVLYIIEITRWSAPYYKYMSTRTLNRGDSCWHRAWTQTQTIHLSGQHLLDVSVLAFKLCFEVQRFITSAVAVKRPRHRVNACNISFGFMNPAPQDILMCCKHWTWWVYNLLKYLLKSKCNPTADYT